METNPFKSPRKIEEEITAYKRERFEDYMCMVDRGEITQGLAIAALTDELALEETWRTLNP